jgi:mannose-6-phosphate isomerase-like protein (cupin superfamily)
MLIRHLLDCPEIVAGDETLLRELLHPGRNAGTYRYSLAHAVVLVGKASRPHRLRSSEVYYILRGEGEMHVDRESAHVRAGHALLIPPGSHQYIRNTGPIDLEFLCIVDPAWRSEDEEPVAVQEQG